MRTAQKRQSITQAVSAMRGIIWIEDLYLALLKQGHRVSIRTVYETIWSLEREGLVQCRIQNRRTMVELP